MSPSAVAPHIQSTLDEIEARARDFETRAGECRDAAATIRRAFGISTIVPDETPAPRRALLKAAPSAKPGPKARTTAASSDGPDTLDDEILEVLVAAGEEMRAADVYANLPKRSRPSEPIFKLRLRALVAQGRVTMTGKTRATRYSATGRQRRSGVPKASGARGANDEGTGAAPAMVPHQSDAAAAVPRPEAPARVDSVVPLQRGQEDFAVRVRAWLLSDFFTSARPHYTADIVFALQEEFDQATLDLVEPILTGLVRAGILERTHLEDGTTYRRLATVAAGHVDAVMKVLASGSSYDVGELLAGARQFGVADVTRDQVTDVVAHLVGKGKVTKIPMGSTIRYRKL